MTAANRAIAFLMAALLLLDGLAPLIGGSFTMVQSAMADDDDDDDEDDDDDDDDDRRLRRAPPRAKPPARPAAAIRELVVTNVDQQAIERLRAAGFRIVAQRATTSLGGFIVRASPPRRLARRQAESLARSLAPDAIVDRNHLYERIFHVQSAPSARSPAFPEPLRIVNWPSNAASCRLTAPIGLIDAGFRPDHPALGGRAIFLATVRGPGLAPSAGEHGSLVAGLLVGKGPGGALLPAADILAVDAFHRRGSRDLADAFDLASAIDLLVSRGVRVINLSLAGPPNAALDRVGRAAREKGVHIVAAAGNAGPSAPPLYPAAYKWAVAVTAIDKDRRVYARAARGAHIDLAAPGVGIVLQDQRGRARTHSGTSFAAPFVSAALALRREAAEGAAADDALASLLKAVKDLGPSGRDEMFGEGLLQAPDVCG